MNQQNTFSEWSWPTGSNLATLLSPRYVTRHICFSVCACRLLEIEEHMDARCTPCGARVPLRHLPQWGPVPLVDHCSDWNKHNLT